MALGTWILTGTTDTLDDLRNYIAAPPVNLRGPLSHSEAATFGWIFSRPSNPGQRRSPLEIRGSDLLGGNALLFSGRWMLSYRAGEAANPRDFYTLLKLSLNPLRFVRNQPSPRPMPSAEATHGWPAPRLIEHEMKPDARGEFALDGNDNWLPDTDFHHSWANSSRWKRHLRNYVLGVADAFTGELQRVTTAHGGAFRIVQDFTLRKVEVAWEFASPEPTQLVQSLSYLLGTYRGLDMEANRYRAHLSEGRAVNSLSVTLRIRQGISLRVYAKTNRRVRFEILHEVKNLRDLLGEPRLTRGQQGSTPPRPWAEVFGAFAKIRQVAANELNGVLEHLQRQAQVVPSQISAFSFLVAVANALQNHALAQTVVSLLLAHGKITAKGAGGELLDACRSLAKAGIFSYDSTRLVYDVTPSYKHARDILHAFKPGHFVTDARRRTRDVPLP